MNERARHELHARLDEVLGPEVTGTLIELLAPVGWGDVATKHDLDVGLELLGHRMDARVSDLRADLAEQMSANQRQLVFGLFGAVAANAGVVWAALATVG